MSCLIADLRKGSKTPEDVPRTPARRESLVPAFSPSELQSREFLRKAKRFVSRLGLPIRCYGDHQVSLQLPDCSRFAGIPGKVAPMLAFSHCTRIGVEPTECPRIGQAFLDQQFRSMEDRWFRQEYLSEFHDAITQLISEHLLSRVWSDHVPPMSFD